MDTKIKILIWAGAVLVIGALVFIIVKQVEINKRQQAIETEIVLQKELADNIMRSQKEWATKKDIEDFAKEHGINLDVIKKDLDKLHADVNGINVVVAKSYGQRQTNMQSTDTNPGGPGPSHVECNGTQVTCPDPYGYLRNTQELKLNEKFSNTEVPIGQVGFSAWKDKPWDVTVYPRTYTSTTVLGRDEDGKEYAYNKLQVEVNGQKTDIKIDNSRFLQDYPQPHFSFWNPRLFLGISGGLGIETHNAEISPNLNLAIMSYGQFKDQPSWTFLSLGVGYATQNKKLNFQLTPVQYNVGRHIPLTKNIYIGPSIAVDTDATVYLFGSLSVGL